MKRGARAVTLLLAVLLGACARPPAAAVTGPLAIDISELCTRCVEVLKCEGEGAHRIYVLAEKSAWAQIATIGDYFLQYVRPKSEDFRDVKLYDSGAEPPRLLEARERGARLDVMSRRIELPDGIVVQKDGSWLDAAGQPKGHCTHVPRGEDRALAKRLAASAMAIGGG